MTCRASHGRIRAMWSGFAPSFGTACDCWSTTRGNPRAGVGSAWARGLQIDCGCFGGGGAVAAADTAYPAEILRDSALLLVALALARWPRSRLALGGRPLPEEEFVRAR